MNKHNKPGSQVGDIVAVFIPTWDKWIRGQVERDDVDGNVLVWAIDYGLPVLSKRKRIMPLSMELANDPLRVVFVGGVVNSVPSKPTYVLNKGPVPTETQDWSENVIRNFEDIIKQSAVIEFDPVVQDGGHTFGHLTFYMDTGLRCKAVDVMCEQAMKKTTEEFLDVLHKTQALSHARYRDNTGQARVWNSEFLVIEKPIEPANNDDMDDAASLISMVDLDASNSFFDDSASQIYTQHFQASIPLPSTSTEESKSPRGPIGRAIARNQMMLSTSNQKRVIPPISSSSSSTSMQIQSNSSVMMSTSITSNNNRTAARNSVMPSTSNNNISQLAHTPSPKQGNHTSARELNTSIKTEQQNNSDRLSASLARRQASPKHLTPAIIKNIQAKRMAANNGDNVQQKPSVNDRLRL